MLILILDPKSLIDSLQIPEGFPSVTEPIPDADNVTLNNPGDSSDQEAKRAINALTRSFMQCEQSTNIKRMQRVSLSDLCEMNSGLAKVILVDCDRTVSHV